MLQGFADSTMVQHPAEKAYAVHSSIVKTVLLRVCRNWLDRSGRLSRNSRYGDRSYWKGSDTGLYSDPVAEGHIIFLVALRQQWPVHHHTAILQAGFQLAWLL